MKGRAPARASEKMERVQFSVVGRGRFPIDMLRYDACFPGTEEDALLIDRLLRDPEGFEGALQYCEVRLAAWQRPGWRPNADRWASFGWSTTRVF